MGSEEEEESGGLVAVMLKYSFPASKDIWVGGVGVGEWAGSRSVQRLMPSPHELLKVSQRRVGGSQAANYRACSDNHCYWGSFQ